MSPQEPPLPLPSPPLLPSVKTEVTEPETEEVGNLCPSTSTFEDLDDENLRSALILGVDDYGPLGGKLQLQIDPNEGRIFCNQLSLLVQI